MLLRRAMLVFLFFSLAYALFNSFRDSVQMPDEEYVLNVTSNLVSGKSLALSDTLPLYHGASRQGVDGKNYAVYQIGQSLLYAPFYFTAKLLIGFFEPYDAATFNGSRVDYLTWLERETRRYILFCPLLFAAASCALFFLFGCGLGLSERASLILTLFYGFGTMVWPYSKYLLTESVQNALLLATVYLLFLQRSEGRLIRRAMVGAGALFGFLLCIRANLIVLLPVLAFYWFYANKERRLTLPGLLFAVPMAVMFIPQLIYDDIRFGGLLSTGYDTALFSTPLFVGLYGFLFSSGKSFFLYAPVTLLFFLCIRSFWKRAPHEARLFSLIVLILPLKYAAWWVWSGDPAWGPRYLLLLTPFVLLPAGELVEKALPDKTWWRKGSIAFLFLVSLGIQLLAISIHYLYYLNYVQRASNLVPPSFLVGARTPDESFPVRDRYLITEFVPEYSPILGHVWLVGALLSGDPKPAAHAPWKGLGYTALHADAPLKIQWDIWFLEIFRRGNFLIQIKKLLGGFALTMLLWIVAQELFRNPIAGED
jgi:hypothetical protein